MADYNLGARHLSNKTVGELQRSNNFYVQFPNLPEEVSFLIKGFVLPSSENEVITIKYGNAQIKLPGPASFSEGELTIYDSITQDTEAKIDRWRRRVYNPETEAIGNQADYKEDATVTEFSPDGAIARQWVLEGCWPSSFKPGDIAADSSDVKTMTLTIQYDRAYRK